MLWSVQQFQRRGTVSAEPPSDIAFAGLFRPFCQKKLPPRRCQGRAQDTARSPIHPFRHQTHLVDMCASGARHSLQHQPVHRGYYWDTPVQTLEELAADLRPPSIVLPRDPEACWGRCVRLFHPSQSQNCMPFHNVTAAHPYPFPPRRGDIERAFQ